MYQLWDILPPCSPLLLFGSGKLLGDGQGLVLDLYSEAMPDSVLETIFSAKHLNEGW